MTNSSSVSLPAKRWTMLKARLCAQVAITLLVGGLLLTGCSSGGGGSSGGSSSSSSGCTGTVAQCNCPTGYCYSAGICCPTTAKYACSGKCYTSSGAAYSGGGCTTFKTYC